MTICFYFYVRSTIFFQLYFILLSEVVAVKQVNSLKI
uniref:Uncharacterized protein n=1 Tax=Rhizophora mucronata TaxID=61149 RepID=A0A2P2KAG4_RHIMU